MTDYAEQEVVDDTSRPYKMYAAMAAGLVAVLLTYSDVLPLPIVIALAMLGTALGVYNTPNPKERVNKAHKNRKKPHAHGEHEASS